MQMGLTIKRVAQANPDAEAVGRAFAGELVQYFAYYAPAQLVRWAAAAMSGQHVVDFSVLQAISPIPLLQKYVQYIWCTFDDDESDDSGSGSRSYQYRAQYRPQHIFSPPHTQKQQQHQ